MTSTSEPDENILALVDQLVAVIEADLPGTSGGPELANPVLAGGSILRAAYLLGDRNAQLADAAEDAGLDVAPGADVGLRGGGAHHGTLRQRCGGCEQRLVSPLLKL